jgi:putative ubiquitin-RnfH superfamily antitoxin RatB of RatAB toxin-antitoxin module
VPADGDRIELYRSLLIEPRENRRARAAKALAANKRRR